MSQTTSGENDSSGAGVARLDLALDRFEEGLALPPRLAASSENRARELLALAPAELRSLTADDCGEASFTLRQFAFFLQRAANREAARARWAEETVRRLTAADLARQKGASYEERRLLAVRQNGEASRVDGERVKALLRLDRISFLSAKAESMAASLTSMAATRRSDR